MEEFAKGGGFLVESISPQGVFTPEDFNEEQRLIAKTVTGFVAGEIKPVADDIEEKKEGLLPALLKKAGELGFLSAEIPEEYGGQDLDKVSCLLIWEKMARGGGSFISSFGAHTGLGSLPIVFFGTKDQKRRYLPKMATGEIIGAYALTEPDAGSDALNSRATAILSPDRKYYILNGRKQFITNAGFAGIFITYAKVDGDKFTSFIVERDFGGISLDKEENKMGVRGASTRGVIYSDVRVPVENILGEIGRGNIVALSVLNFARLSLGAGCVGRAKSALHEAVTYAKKRVQFGRPIAEFSLIKYKLAEMTVRTFIAESMVYRTGGLTDLILRHLDRQADDAGIRTARGMEEYSIEASINKVFCSEMAGYVIDEAVQIHGGYGYIRDYPVERGYRDERINRIWEGTNEINRLLIVNMLTRKIMKNRLPVLEAAQKVAGELPDRQPGAETNSTQFVLQKEMVEVSKKIGLLVAGAAIEEYMMKLTDPEREDIAALISDIIIEVFAMESGLLRAMKTAERLGDAKSRIQKNIVKVYVNDGFTRVENLAKQAFAAIAEGDVLRTKLSALKKLACFEPADTVALRREIADSVIEAGGYLF